VQIVKLLQSMSVEPKKSSAEHSINLADTLQDHPESNYTEIPRKVRYHSYVLSDYFESGGKMT